MSDQSIEIEDDPQEVEILPEGGEGGGEAPAARAPAQEAEVDGVAQLKANMDAERRRADQAESRAKQLEQARQQDAQRHQAGAIDGQIAQINAAKEAAEARIERLMGQRTAALQAGDYANEGKLTRQLAVEQAKISQYDGGLYTLQEAKKQPQPQRQAEQQRQPEARQEQQPANAVEAFVQRNRLGGEAASFIRENPGFIATDRSIRRLADAHEDAIEGGHAEGTKAYYDFIKSSMAPRQAAATQEAPAAPQRRPQPSAPPSRSSGDVGVPRRKLTLTAQEARTASEIGINMKDPKQVASYARELDKQKRGAA